MLTLTDARNLLNTKFAAWIRDLNLAVETLSPSSARLVLPIRKGSVEWAAQSADWRSWRAPRRRW